jgi:hypothetical protein
MRASGPEACGLFFLVGQSHDVALGVGDQSKRHTGDVLGLLDNPAAEFRGRFTALSTSSTATKKVTRSLPPCSGLIAVNSAPGTPVSTKV